MKIIGGIFILCASIYVSYLYEKQQKSKLTYLSKIVDFICYVKSQIEHFSTPYNKIIDEYTTDENLKALIFSGFKEYLDVLSLEDKKAIKSFFSSISKGFVAEELSLCEYTISTLQHSIEKIKKENPNKIKVFRSMVLFVAISIIILLV